MAVTLTTNLRNEYQLLFDSCLIRPARLAAASTMAARVSANRNRYQTVGKPLGIPWYLVGLVHAMEASLNFSALGTDDARPRRPPGRGPPPVHLGGERHGRAQARGPRLLDGLEPARPPLQARALQRLGLPRPASARADPLPVELLEPLHEGEVRRRRNVFGQRGVAAVRRRGDPQAARPDRRRAARIDCAAGAAACQPAHDRPGRGRGATAAREEPVRRLRPGHRGRRLRLGVTRRDQACQVGPRVSARPGRRVVRTGARRLPVRQEAPASRLQATACEAACGRAGRSADQAGDRQMGALGRRPHQPHLLHQRRRAARSPRHAGSAAARHRLLRVRDALLQLGEGAEPERQGPLQRRRRRVHRDDADALQAHPAECGEARRPRRLDPAERGTPRLRPRLGRRRSVARLPRRRRHCFEARLPRSAATEGQV